MSEEQMSEARVTIEPTLSLDELIALNDRPIKPGQIIKARVEALTEKAAELVSVEHPDHRGALTLKKGTSLSVGAELDIYVEEVEGATLTLSLGKAERLLLWESLHAARKASTPVKARVLALSRGGLSVDVGLKAFLPAGQTVRAPGQSLESLIGETFEVKITRLEERKGQITVSRKALLAPAPKEAPEGADEATDEDAGQEATPLTAPEVGQIMSGTVTRLAPFGAFVELGGYEGLLHVNDMSWGRVSKPEDVVEPGQSVELKVMSVKDFDQAKKRRVKLSLKEMGADPWTEVTADQYPEGAQLSGTVVGTTDFGAFVEVAPGLEGLVHVSEMSWTDRVKHPRDRVTVGEQLDVKVLQCDPTQRRLSLSLKLTEHNPWHGLAERYPVGTRIRGKVARITRFGLFVALEEGIDGLVHTRDISWIPGSVNLKATYSPGQDVEALVLNIEEDRGRVSLGIKQLTPDNTAEIYSQFSPDQQVTGQVTNIREFGAFVSLAPGIEGLIHRSEMGHGPIKRPRDHLRKGQTITARILTVDPAAGRIGLTLKGEADEIKVELPIAEPPSEAAEPANSPEAAEAAATAAPEAAAPKAEAPEAEAPAAETPTAETPTAETPTAETPASAEDEPAGDTPTKK